MSILHIEGATKRFGGFTAINRVSLAVEEGATHAVIGPNGAGKTTLFNLVSGLIAPDEGSVTFRGQRLAMDRTTEVKINRKPDLVVTAVRPTQPAAFAVRTDGEFSPGAVSILLDYSNSMSFDWGEGADKKEKKKRSCC